MQDDFYEDDEPLADVLAAFERAAKGVTEPIRRQLAQRHRDDFEPGSAQPVKPKALGTVMSVRLTGEQAGALRDAAVRQGASVSDLIRRLADESHPVGFRCNHVAITTGGSARLTSATSQCGCDMQPIYAAA